MDKVQYTYIEDKNNLGFKGKGGTRKVGEVPSPCLSPEHNPPSHIVLQPGVYEHTCPACGHQITFTVPRVSM